MDAKPQRPLRLRTFRDENQPPNALAGKTLHQRNKSSPALSTLAQTQAGNTRLGPKRSVFADVSNTSWSSNSVKDDSVIALKPKIDIAKENAVDSNKAPVALQKPAQRPLSVSGLKGFLNTLGSAAHINAPKQVPADVPSITGANLDPALKAPIARKILPRKSTAIFREPEVAPPASLEPANEISAVKDSVLLAGPIKKGLVLAENCEPVLEPVPLLPDPIPSSSDTIDEILSADLYESRSDGVALPAYDSYSRPKSSHDVPAKDSSAYENGLPNGAALQGPTSSNIENTTRRSSRLSATSAKSTSIAANDRRWDDEAYPDYEDEDYTTAPSVKSRGEFTTNPTTIVLAPRMTESAEREIAAATKFVRESPEVNDLEEDEFYDTSMVSEYGEEIFAYMRILEEQMRPNPYYMDSQTEVQWSMRSVLMDWLVQVHHRFSLLPETLFLCVNYIDRFLSCKIVSLGKLQLVGATAIFVAAKYEEINCPSVQEIVYMVDGGYTIDEILKAERFMLSMLQFELGWPGPMSFLRRISKADDYDLETRTLAKYFLEITIMDERFVGCIPSFTAAGAHCLARLMLKKGYWSQKHVHYSGYTFTQLRTLLSTILSCCEDAQKHHAAVFDKYSDKRFKRASCFVQTEIKKGFVLPSLPRPTSFGNGDMLESTWKPLVF